jgi:VanZ family protein
LTPAARRGWLAVGGGVAIQVLVTSLPGRDVPISVGHPWDWLIHATMYGGLAFLVVRAATLSEWQGARRRLPWLGVALSAYGALDEVHQLFIAGRDGSPSDWAFDTAGAAAGLLIGSWLMASKVAKWLR